MKCIKTGKSQEIGILYVGVVNPAWAYHSWEPLAVFIMNRSWDWFFKTSRALWPARACLIIDSVRASVCPLPRLLITSGVI